MTTLPVHFTLGIPGLRPSSVSSYPSCASCPTINNSLELEYSYDQGEELWKYRNSDGAWESIGSSGLALSNIPSDGNEACIDLYIRNVSSSNQCFIVWRVSEEQAISLIVFDVSPQFVGHAALRIYSSDAADGSVPWHVQARKDPVIKIHYQFSTKPPAKP